jgi:hypothetical protein
MTDNFNDSIKALTRNSATKKYLFVVFILVIYFSSLLLYTEYWKTLIDFLWFNPIASRFKSSNIFFVITYGFLIAIILVYYVIVFVNQRRNSKLRTGIVFFILTLFFSLFGSFEFSGYWALGLIGELLFCELAVLIKTCSYKEINLGVDYNGLEFEHPILRTKEQILNGKEIYGRTDYVISTHSLLKNTFDSKAAFAVGISGKWGSGKTSFTNDLKTLLNDDVDIVMEFKPWFCKSPNEVIEDFFNEYRYNISTFIPGLNSKLKFYMDTLQNVEFHNSAMRISLKNFIPQKSSERIYGEIIDTLKKAAVKVVIIIDDLDRLDKDEILEVLRLIRNTANFPYTQFIVTYDKDYVLQTLPLNSKVNYNDFLIKIFNLEIALPSYEKNILCLELEKRIILILRKTKIQHDEGEVHNMIFVRMTYINDNFEIFEEDKKQPTHYNNLDLKIPQILTTMRDVIRFSNSFELNLNSFVKDERSEIEYKDFFYLELLHYKYSDVYYDLKEDPLKYLDFTGEGRYQIENPYSKDKNPLSKDNKIDALFKEKKGVNQEVIRFLFEILFSKDRKFVEKSIASLSNYFTYFACRLDNRNLSLANIILLLSMTPEDALKEVVRWYEVLEIYEGQLEDKLTRCFQSIIHIEKNQYAEIASNKVYELIQYLYDHVNIEEQKVEIFSSITNHISSVSNTHSGHLNMEESQYLAFLKFCLTFFDVIEEKDSDVNHRLIEFVFEDEKMISDTVFDLFSNDITSLRFASRIDKYISDLSFDSKDLSGSKTNLNKLVQIQYNRLRNRISTLFKIDVYVLDFYSNSVGSARKMSNKNMVDDIKKYFKEVVYRYPVSFFVSNIRIGEEIIATIIPFGNIFNTKVDFEKFQNALNDSSISKENEWILNLWELFKVNNYEPISTFRFEKYDISNLDFKDDVRKQSALAKLYKEIKDLIFEFEKSNIGNFDKRGLVSRLKSYESNIDDLNIRFITKQLSEIQMFIVDKINQYSS